MDLEIAAPLTDRQSRVMRAVVAGYVGAAAPVGSNTVSHLLSVPLSAASIRSTMAELADLGLIEKPHSSAGRVPTERGLRHFVDHLLDPQQVGQAQSRWLRQSFGETDAEGAMQLASHILSESTRQLGFVVVPRLDRVRLRHVTLVRLSHERVLVLLVTVAGRSYNRIVDEERSGDQSELDRIAAVLNDRIRGRTLGELRKLLVQESRRLRERAESVLARAVVLGQHALALAEEADAPADLVVATRLSLLDQPEFNDPERLRELFSAIEENEKLVQLMVNLLDVDGVRVALGRELDESGLSRCALVTAPYGATPTPSGSGTALGVLGVIGPSRMDYARIIPMVNICSQLVTEKFNQSACLGDEILS